MSLLIAIEGIDGSGKGTQAAALVEKLSQAGHKAALISFPRYEHTLFGKAIGDYLNGRFGSLESVSPFLVSLLFAGDRFESRGALDDARRANDVVVLDRFVASNIAHQAAKLEPEERDELVQWIERIEHEIYGLPRPDVTIWLELPVDLAQELIAKKSHRSYTDRAADLHESDRDYLVRVREVYRQLAGGDPTWRRIECAAGETVRPLDAISEEIFHAVASLLPQ